MKGDEMKGLCAGLFSLTLLAGLAAPGEEAPKTNPPEEKKDSAPPLPAFPLKSEYFQYVLDKTEDDEEATQLETHAVEDILVALLASTDEHLNENVTPAVKTETAYRELMKHSEQYRGHVVQLRGTLEFVERFPVPDNRSGLSALFRGQISTITGALYTFFSIQRPPDELMRKPVRITGVFLKFYAYKNRDAGEKYTWTPAVFVRRVEAYSEADVPPTQDPISRTTALLVAIFLAFIVVRVLLEFRRQRVKAARENPFQQRRRKAGAASPPRPGPAPEQKKP
jgi:hypothetical protein